MDLFVTCSAGIELLLIEELHELGFPDTTPGYLGVYVANSSLEAIYRINYGSRLASRVLLPIARFKCYDRNDLYREISAIDWSRYLHVDKTFAIDANVSHHRELRNSLFATQVAKDAICDQFSKKKGRRPSIDRADPFTQLNLFIQKDMAVISFDTSGTPLHKRGYRLEEVEAPMRQSLAAALLRLAQYRSGDILCDPCCGSGTLLIEAAYLATNTPPGFLRKRWGFTQLPNFSQVDWLRVKNEADAKRIPLPPGQIFGIDINKSAVHACKVNLRAAGLHQTVQVAQGDFREWTPPRQPNFLITNPPHGRRLDDIEFLRPLYRSLGDFMKRELARPARGFVFTGELELAKEVGLAPTKRHVIDNAGIDSRLLEYEIY